MKIDMSSFKTVMQEQDGVYVVTISGLDIELTIRTSINDDWEEQFDIVVGPAEGELGNRIRIGEYTIKDISKDN